MPNETHGIYRVWYYLQIQASLGAFKPIYLRHGRITGLPSWGSAAQCDILEQGVGKRCAATGFSEPIQAGSSTAQDLQICFLSSSNRKGWIQYFTLWKPPFFSLIDYKFFFFIGLKKNWIFFRIPWSASSQEIHIPPALPR